MINLVNAVGSFNGLEKLFTNGGLYGSVIRFWHQHRGQMVQERKRIIGITSIPNGNYLCHCIDASADEDIVADFTIEELVKTKPVEFILFSTIVENGFVISTDDNP